MMARSFLSSLLLLLLTACGGGGGGGSASTPVGITPTSTPATSTPTANPTPSTVVSSSPAPAATPVTPKVVSDVLNLDFAALLNYTPTLPNYYDVTVLANDNTPASPVATDAIATLGRVLFYDKNLSINNTTACASCHQASHGFSDPARFSVGFSGTAFTSAHSMRLGNIRFYRPGSMFWDKRAASVELQASQPIQNAVEMGFDVAHGGMSALLSKAQALGYYPELFKLAYGDIAVTEPRIQTALAQFERAMVASNSRWDAGYALNYNPSLPDQGLGAPIASFTAAENRGRDLFMRGRGGANPGAGCAACHVPPTFVLAPNSKSNGLDLNETRIFKSPSLKNIALSGAFMHDGRFSTLAQVIEHYSSGIQAGTALDARLPAGGLNLTPTQKADLEAFLLTLTDTQLNNDAKFANPFK
ncbi:cytochrome-c peroxidase [Chitinibacter bivalviorum]|uniref:Cytochrome-c peroxidase n=1 Tax=Chitinibacter bivalviorum TaxID=2739434 RepID=A0A7H9BPY5_9NEIS|nr:cytochrome c peroxidase [Chitinibacter bivalviorum]QLG89404.1 cytochrome-c peroxidase [Chitinibacter bivalviorum]